MADDARRAVRAPRVGAGQGQTERVEGAVQLLQLLTDDPAFAWLRPLSALIVDLDERLVDPQPDLIDVTRASLTALWMPTGTFWPVYARVLQEDPSAAVAHGEVRAALAALPSRSPAAAHVLN
ncbi:MAG: hypothetical protein NVS4B10_20160 [Myxococcales bacterium]